MSLGLTDLLIKTLPTIRLIPSQVRNEESNQSNDQKTKTMTRKWFKEKSRCSAQTDNIIDVVVSPKRQLSVGSDVRRPVTSSIYDSHIRTIGDIHVRSKDI